MSGITFASLFAKNLPVPTPRFAGLPKHNFIGGHNDPELIPVEALAEAAAAVIRREGRGLALYNQAHGPLGYRPLRAFIVDKLARHRGIACTADDVLVLSGSGQGLELVNRLLLDRGDTVLMEELTYNGTIAKARSVGATVVGVPLDEHGMRMDVLAAILEDLKKKGVTPKFLYTIPTIQNPTGSVLPLDRRHEMIRLAKAYGVPIFEDECYADLVWSGTTPPALYGLDPSQVIHIGSFSKTLSPAMRVGYLVADWAAMTQLLPLKTDSGTGALNQMVIAEYFSKNFDAHVRRLTGVLAEKMATMVDALEQEFGTDAEITRPDGGIYVWVTFPEKLDVTKVFKPATDHGIGFNPGPEWTCTPGGHKNSMRLCFALPTKAQIREGVAALAKVCYETTGIPERGANVRRGEAR